MKKVHLKSWKLAWQTKKNKTVSGVAPFKDDSSLYTFLGRHSLKAPHSPDPSSWPVVIFDAIVAVQSMRKSSWVRNKHDLESHFIEVVDAKSNVATEVHVVFDR